MSDEMTVHVTLDNLNRYHKLPEPVTIVEGNVGEQWLVGHIRGKGWVATNGRERFPKKSQYATQDEIEKFLKRQRQTDCPEAYK